MSIRHEEEVDPPSVPLALSVLCDGEAGDRQIDIALAAWSSDAVSRQAWQDWHLIGDALRSDELAQPGASDEAFLAGLRVRIAADAAPSRGRRGPGWLRPAIGRRAARWSGLALAAGVAGLAVLGGVWQAAPARLEGTVVARAFQSLGWERGGAALQAADGALIRDARLDAYLRAHRAGEPALPGGATGRFETVSIDR